jgi:type I restriction-modification system DNA methylase subunit
VALFQKSVQNDYLNRIQDSSIKEYWEYYDSYFNNPEQQKLIEQQKERKFYSEFIDELFVNCLGYTKKIGESQNYFIEEKNETDSKLADGAVKVNGEVVAVMEFKDTTTKNLKDVESQAFGYKNTHPKCNYIVTCNFKELWFYIDNTTSKEPFNLFNLSYDDFKLLWLCLSYESISTNLPEQIKNKSVTEEEEITKKLYSDYSLFRNEIFNDLVNKNPQFGKLLLFKKTQKLLDRFLFIFFAEDRLLLPTNSIAKIIKKWEDDIAFGEEKSLYTTFVFYFNLLNKGRPASKEREEIFAYNGGLFAPDEMLDSIVIDDELLSKHTKKLSSYDFISDVSVNILGHIFEHSLSQIEEIQNEISGFETDKSKSKRKKDGVFYTPAYITKYIVENTVGKLCKEKREELEFNEAEFVKDRKGRQKNTLEKLSIQLDNYREWLLGITICDPACGSGAFLVEALNFLIDEHKYIDELRASLFGESIQFSDITASILENNLYGVDINEESVEIAKLSLWLRTAQKGRKLTSLSDNLKCGNSLIDDPEVAGNKAFNWENEFPEVFGNGGFDVVIGNPPYVQIQGLGETANDLKNQNFKTFERTGDLYCLFYELGNIILREKGLLGFITSNKWMRAKYGKSLRNYLINETQPLEIIDLGSGIFESATVDSNILIFVKNSVTNKPSFSAIDLSKEKSFLDFTIYKEKKVEIKIETDKNWIISNQLEIKIKKKIEAIGKPLKDWGININRGVLTGLNDAFIIDKKTKEKLINQDYRNEKIIFPILRGRDLNRYFDEYSELFLINTHNGYKGKEPINIEEYQSVKKHLDNFQPQLEKRGDKGFTPYNLRNCAYVDDFFEINIFYPDICQRLSFTLVDSMFSNNTGYYLNTNNKYLLSILNSKLINYYYKTISAQLGEKGIRCFTIYIQNIPIPQIEKDKQLTFVEKADQMLLLNKDLQKESFKFLRTLQRNFEGLDKLSKKLENWFELTFTDFVKELKKKKIKLSLGEETKWEDYFLQEQQNAVALKQQINNTDNEIDQMVYELYGLTQEEIEIVENATK